jgi:hypothetical protein
MAIGALFATMTEGKLRALKIGLLIMAGLALIAIIPAGRLPNYIPGEVPSDQPQRTKPGEERHASASSRSGYRTSWGNNVLRGSAPTTGVPHAQNRAVAAPRTRLAVPKPAPAAAVAAEPPNTSRRV